MSSSAPLIELLIAMADDELVLGHRDAEWTGHAPILEEDIAFSNIAQDEIGHSLIWYHLLEPLTGLTPDQAAFVRPAKDFRCCRFVAYPKGDFAYTVVRQYLFDEAEQVRLTALAESTNEQLRQAAAKLLPEETYHLLHTKGLVERLGRGTDESRGRMQAALDIAFPQALGMFESLSSEDQLIRLGIFPGHRALQRQWIERILPVLSGASLSVGVDGSGRPLGQPDLGGRIGAHTPYLLEALSDLQRVYNSEPGAIW
ncbi:MAG: phenylacetate-CoA oxygenase subunit PaaC [Bacteroidetes bacterium]|jgi:ring-1,2-phenylacetyl-CoA epoxidase subunit PaaC|nr:phenylacetate-CoA oxygenase subunit PaaC [Bacteroidota bacterium]